MSTSAQIFPINYYADSADWFIQICHYPKAVWLDSGKSRYGRFDILSANPSQYFETLGEVTHLGGEALEDSSENPFELLARVLPLNHPALAEIPFCGGAIGYWSYDLGRRLENLPVIASADIKLADMSLGLYPWAIVQDHEKQRAWLVTNPALAPAYNFSKIMQICSETQADARFHELKQNLKSDKNTFKIKGFEANLKVDDYRRSFARIKDYIMAGDCYQVNFAQRFSSYFQGNPLAAFLALRESLPSPFSAYMALDKGAVLSLSPERFIKLQGTAAETKPIKGTLARGLTAEQDALNAERLLTSLKDRAENLMIVDLLRNDLSKTCDQVRVPKLFELQSFANVHHLVSTVTGILKPGMTALDLLSKAFPGGSITGAPKIRAMEIIEELEPVRRSLYCGSIGYISACGTMDTNIAIRTLICDQEKIYCWGGGGIVADSEWETEYGESVAKVNVLLQTLEQLFGSTR